MFASTSGREVDTQLDLYLGARGSYSMEFSHYDEVPGHLADKVIANAKAGVTGEVEEEE